MLYNIDLVDFLFLAEEGTSMVTGLSSGGTAAFFHSVQFLGVGLGGHCHP